MSKNTINSNFHNIVTVDENFEPLKIKPEYLDLPASSFSGSYNDLTDKPTLGTAAATDSTDYATAAQGAKADTAVQPTAIGVTIQPFNANTVVDSAYVHTDNNYTSTEKSKLAGIQAGAEVNVNADWTATTGDAVILNKPTLGTAAATDASAYATAAQGAKADTAVQPASLATVATSGNYNDLTNKPAPFDPGTLAAVATTGSYTDLIDKPTIPTLTSQLTNDSGFIAGGDVPTFQVKSNWTETDIGSAAYIQNKPTLGTAAATDASAYATAAQGTKADSAVQTVQSSDGSLALTRTGNDIDIIVATAGSTTNLQAEVRNETGATLVKGTVVYITGGAGNKALVSKALATSDATSAGTFGMVTADIPNNHNGYVTITGKISGLNTSTYPEGTVLYLSPTVAGGYTNVKPQAPNHIVYVGTVIYSHTNQGTIQTRIQNGYELDEIHDVKITSVQNGDIIKYDSALGVWVNTPDTGGGGGTPCEPVLKLDASRPVAYVARGTKIIKLDYTSGMVPVRSKFITANLESDWPTRSTLTYTLC